MHGYASADFRFVVLTPDRRTPNPLLALRACAKATAGETPTLRRGPSLGDFRAHEGEGLGGELLFAREHPPPDFGGSGDVGQGEAEGFDHQPAVVVDGAEGVEVFAPANEALAGGAAVVFADVNVAQHVGAGVQCKMNRLLLD